MRVPELTFRLLEPLGIFSRLQERAPLLLFSFTWKECFPNCFLRFPINSDTAAVFSVIPRYQRYCRGNLIEIHGSTAVMGLELTVFPR